MLTEIPSSYHAREDIHEQSEVDEAVLEADVGDIAHPDLIASTDFKVFEAVPPGLRPLSGVGRLTRAFHRYRQVLFFHQGETPRLYPTVCPSATNTFVCELESWKDCMEPASRSIYDHVIWDSDVEKQFVEGLERRDDIILYVKLPAFFTVPTPIGDYNPDWAIVREDRDAHGEPTDKENLYLVRETKGTTDSGELRLREERKINCGTRHFRDALGVDYDVVTSAVEV